MSRRARFLLYGASIGLCLVGVVCGATLPDTLGGTLATALIGIGLVGVVSLVFYEVGLTEDRDRAKQPPPVARGPRHDPDRAIPNRLIAKRRLERQRGDRRRLR